MVIQRQAAVMCQNATLRCGDKVNETKRGRLTAASQLELFAFDGFELLAIGQVGSPQLAGHDEDFNEGCPALGLYQGIDSASWQLVEGCVGRREYRERTLTLQSFDKAGGLHGSDERGVILRVDGILNNILGREHRSSTITEP